MADNKILVLGLLAGGGYLAYRMLSASTDAAAAAETTPVTDTGAAATSAPAAAAPSAATVSALDGYYQSLKSAVANDSYFSGSGDSRASSVDHWNYYLGPIVGLTIPAGLFTGDTSNLTAAQYWAVMAPWIQAQKGLSGLGFYGGLGALVRRRAF